MNIETPESRRVDLAQLIEHLLDMPGDTRKLVGIAGAPGAGKSTFVETLRDSLNRHRPGFAHILAMDGYHFDDRVLEARGDRARKGAPHTFDVGGLEAMLERLSEDNGKDIAVPVFDRSIEIARAGAEIIPASARLVLVEGNYLLLDDPAWAPLRQHFNVTVMLEVPREVLIDRLAARWHGYGMDEAAVREKLDGNDLPNADLVLSHSVAAQLVVANF
ncbi:nucleoside/nucleotide kinase family protein [Trinickia dinghuensis]|uniref:nucleoside/nucleotide kinase family protein n=1 Tax=Trinickia dinghuensis TaxID=2291023 RepID=UPI001FEC9254|nr:nucleoside/nucleotide kinase family protein [Trinickia dinghuensis]